MNRPPLGRMLWRGLLRRCPRCGGGRIFRSWFHMVERCPRCGLRFEREEGFFLGAYVINYGIGSAIVAVSLVVFAVARNADADASPIPDLAAGLAGAVLVPVLFYPFSRTIWSAIDLFMRPLEADEVEEAAERQTDGSPDAGTTTVARDPFNT